VLDLTAETVHLRDQAREQLVALVVCDPAKSLGQGFAGVQEQRSLLALELSEFAVAVCVEAHGSTSHSTSPVSGGGTALDPETVDALRAHREVQLLERDVAGDAYSDRDLVFCNELGQTIWPERLTDWFRAHRKAAGIATGSLHVLRHTAATVMLTEGVPIHIVAARLGDDPKTVLSTYAHLLPQSDELAAERVAAALA
jgi:Phage integrase family